MRLSITRVSSAYIFCVSRQIVRKEGLSNAEGDIRKDELTLCGSRQEE
jgi:hypothetical protein